MVKKSSKDKARRRAQKRVAEQERRARRQQRLEKPLQSADGQEKWTWLDEHVTNFYEEQPAAEMFIEALQVAEELNLLLINEYRYPVAAALASIFRMFPEHHCQWRQEHGTTIKVIEHLYPEHDVPKIDTPRHIDQHLIAWGITRNEMYLDIVFNVAKNQYHPLYYAALGALEKFSVDNEEMQKQIEQAGLLKEKNKVEQIKDLWIHISETDYWNQVAAVKYENNVFVVAHLGDEVITEVPITWNQTAVMQRKATLEEIEAYAAWRNENQGFTDE